MKQEHEIGELPGLPTCAIAGCTHYAQRNELCAGHTPSCMLTFRGSACGYSGRVVIDGDECDKTFVTCRDKYNQPKRFGGFP